MGFSHGAISGNLVFVSGEVALDSTGSVVGLGDIEMQTEITFGNIATVLQCAGASLKDIVYVTVYITDLANYAAFRSTYARIMDGHTPARATLRCDLVIPGLLVEVQVIAVKNT